MDADGWFYLVDRKTDQINASGYKVWPREVEDALYEHPDVVEVAVVGVPDAYRGETVKAVVTLAPAATTGAEELIEAHARPARALQTFPHRRVRGRAAQDLNGQDPASRAAGRVAG